MRPGETEIAMVERHVREGKLHVARQQAIVAEFCAKPDQLSDQSLALAEQMLENFEATQREHVAHLDRLYAERFARETAAGPKALSPWDFVSR